MLFIKAAIDVITLAAEVSSVVCVRCIDVLQNKVLIKIYHRLQGITHNFIDTHNGISTSKTICQDTFLYFVFLRTLSTTFSIIRCSTVAFHHRTSLQSKLGRTINTRTAFSKWKQSKINGHTLYIILCDVMYLQDGFHM